MTFLHSGLRVSELCALRLEDVDPEGKTLPVRVRRGMNVRTIELEKKVIQSVISWLAVRPKVSDDHLFLIRDD